MLVLFFSSFFSLAPPTLPLASQGFNGKSPSWLFASLFFCWDSWQTLEAPCRSWMIPEQQFYPEALREKLYVWPTFCLWWRRSYKARARRRLRPCESDAAGGLRSKKVMEIRVRFSSREGVGKSGRKVEKRRGRKRREEVEEAAHDIAKALVHACWLTSTERFLCLVTASAFLQITSLIPPLRVALSANLYCNLPWHLFI